jgi:hypothetical protein
MSNSRLKASDTPALKPLPGQTSFIESATPSANGQFETEAPDPTANGRSEAEAPNPFDPSRYRLGTNYAEMIGTQSHLLSVPVRKPGKEAFFRAHPTNRLETAVVAVGDDTGDPETFLVERALWPALAPEPMFHPCLLAHYQTRQGVNGLWKIKLPRPGDKINAWTQSALLALARAENEWVRLKSDRALGAYTAETATGITEAPRWPDYDFGRLLEIAFRERLIVSLDHPILRRLRGEV